MKSKPITQEQILKEWGKKGKKRNDEEYQTQCTFFEWRERNLIIVPELRLLHASLNGIRLPIGLALKARRQGMIKGVWDVHWPIARGGWHSLYIETKTKTGDLSDDQVLFLDSAHREGNYCVVCRSAIEMIKVTEKYYSWPKTLTQEKIML